MTPEQLHQNLTSNGIKNGKGQVGVILDTTNYDPQADLFSDLMEIDKIAKWKNNTL